MDHLPKPIGETIHPPVHFYVTESVFKPNDFFIIPFRKDYAIEDYQMLLENGLPKGFEPQVANKFLQEWLFFGLLSQVFGKEIKVDDFKDAMDTVSTKHLRKLIIKWIAETGERDRKPKTNWQTSYYMCPSMALDHARRFTAKHLAHRIYDPGIHATPEKEELQGVHAKVDPKLTLSIALLGETLQMARPDLAMFLQQRNPFWTDRSFEQKSWGYSAYCRKKMLERGMCPAEVRRLESVLGSVRLVYFATFHKRNDPDVYHGKNDDCNFNKCSNPSLERPPMPHISCNEVSRSYDKSNEEKGVSCNYDKSNEEKEVFDAIKAGKVPLTRYNAGHSEWDYVNVLEKKTVYAAVSHSWKEEIFDTGIDARGKHNRQLTLCQLKYLQECVDSAIQDATETHNQPNWFYIDTVCFPRDPTVKAKAIQQMKSIYRNAAAVIVWDRELMERERPAEALEANILIQTGDWCRRLWTLQEAVLAKSLYIAFKKGHVSVKEIEDRREKAKNNIGDDYYFLCDAGWPFSKPIAELRKDGAHSKVQRAWEAVQYRQIRQPEDESLVLAALLDLDVSQIENVKVEGAKAGTKSLQAKRMMKLLELLYQEPGLGIPTGIIFTNEERLKLAPATETRGFEWAPLTWLTRQSHIFPRSRPLQTAAELMWGGLQVKLPGVVLHPPSIDFEQTRIWLPVHPTWHIWYKIEVAHTEKFWKNFWQTIDRTKGVAIILSTAEPKDRWEIGAMVVSKGSLHDRDVRWVQWVCRVWVRLEANTHIIKDMGNRFRSDPAEMCFGERIGEEQRWCIDGVYTADGPRTSASTPTSAGTPSGPASKSPPASSPESPSRQSRANAQSHGPVAPQSPSERSTSGAHSEVNRGASRKRGATGARGSPQDVKKGAAGGAGRGSGPSQRS